MEIIQLDTNFRASLMTMLQRQNIIPIIGAGFTKGARTGHGLSVPDASSFKETMLRTLKTHVGGEAEELASRDFSQVASYFLNPDFVPSETAKEIVAKYFTKVQLDPDRKLFLRLPWPYIFTLNIDDGIENNSSYINRVLPNKLLSTQKRALLLVYKVHGDAVEELLYEQPSSIIFSTGHYIRSLTTNASMLNTLKTVLIEQNSIFLGCSLDYELDILFALAEYNEKFPEGRASIFVTTTPPNRFEQARLAQHGINKILLIDSYEIFYKFFGSCRADLAPPSPTSIMAHSAPERIQKIGPARASNLAFLLRDPDRLKPEQLDGIPHYYFEREIEHLLIAALQKFPLVLLRGRRFSGKTLLIKSIALSIKSRNAYYFNSTSVITQETVEQLPGLHNSVFVFDANVLSEELSISLVKCIEEFRRNNSTLLIAANRTEPDVIGIFASKISDDCDFELPPRLSSQEVERLNRRLDDLGILKFDPRKTLIENTFNHLAAYPNSSSQLLQELSFSDKEIEVLLVALTIDKAYSGLATALDLRVDELFDLCKKLAPVADIIETQGAELREMQSRWKLVVNSRTGLSIQLRHAIKKKGYTWIADRIASVVSKLLPIPRFASVAHSIFMFDSVNGFLQRANGEDQETETTGYRPVVLSLYKQLQPILSHTSDYWLQRAKAVHNLVSDGRGVLEGIDYAIKAYTEAERTRTVDNAEFTIALLYGKLCYIEGFSRPTHVKEAVKWFYNAVKNHRQNPNYVQTMLNKPSFQRLCDHLSGPIGDRELLAIKKEAEHLLKIRNRWALKGPEASYSLEL